MERNIYKIGKELFITSDEEIKVGDKSLLFIEGFKPMTLTHFEPVEEGYLGKKIILTTDQNLINDGIEQISEDTLVKIVEHINSGKNIDSFDKKPITNLEKLLFPELVTELVGYYKNTQLVEKPKEVVEKTTKMYSEEEVKTIINDIVEKHCTYFRQETKDSVKLEWFKKFKK